MNTETAPAAAAYEITMHPTLRGAKALNRVKNLCQITATLKDYTGVRHYTLHFSKGPMPYIRNQPSAMRRGYYFWRTDGTHGMCGEYPSIRGLLIAALALGAKIQVTA
jgi:hypothetical protein